MEYQKCNNCNGSGTILDHMHAHHDGQRSAGNGTSICPSCNGSGNNGVLAASGKQQQKEYEEGYEQAYNATLLFLDNYFGLFPPLIAGIICSTIAYNIIEDPISGWIGASLGFGASMFKTSWRKDFLFAMRNLIKLSVKVTIILAAIIAVSMYFGD